MAAIHAVMIGLGKQAFNLQHVFSGKMTNVDVRSFLISSGWDQTTPVNTTITVDSDAVIGSNSSSAALIVTGNFPEGSQVHIINNGYIVGRGGDGVSAHQRGKDGGSALHAYSLSNLQISITNNGVIAGGGGGGGGGGITDSIDAGGYGGGGAGYIAGNGYKTAADGTLTSGGAGAKNTGIRRMPGGKGGDLGQNGAIGGFYNSGDPDNIGPGAGGQAGKAVIGNSLITWLKNGTRLGSIS